MTGRVARIGLFAACALRAAALAAAPEAAMRSGRLAGPGFYALVRIGNGAIAIEGADVYVDGDTVVFAMEYTSSRGCSVAFFDPPAKKVVSATAQAAIKEGRDALAVALPLETASRAPGFTVLFDPPSASSYVYFSISGGVSALARKPAPAGLLDAAIRPAGSR